MTLSVLGVLLSKVQWVLGHFHNFSIFSPLSWSTNKHGTNETAFHDLLVCNIPKHF